MGGAVTHGGPFNFASNAACASALNAANHFTIATCSCSGGGAAAEAAPTGSAAPGHEFDGTISRAIADGMTGKLSPGNAVGFTVLGMLGNALFAPKTTTAEPAPDPAEVERQLAAHQLNDSGIYLMKQKNYAGAINDFQQALASAPGDGSIRNNLQVAMQMQKNAALAGQNSDALGQLLGTLQETAVNSGSTLDLVNLQSNPNVVDLSNAGGTTVDPATLKGQLDNVFSNGGPAPSTSQNSQPQAQDIDKLFQTQPTPPSSAQSGVDSFNARCSGAAAGSASDAACQQERAAQIDAKQKEVGDLFKHPGGAANTDDQLKDAPNDQNSASNSGSNSSGSGTQTQGTTTRGAFGAAVANPTDLTPAAPLPAQQAGGIISAAAHLKSGAAIAGSNGDLSQLYDAGTAGYAGSIPVPTGISQAPPGSQITREIAQKLAADPKYQRALTAQADAERDMTKVRQRLNVLNGNPPSSENTSQINNATQQLITDVTAIRKANDTENTIIRKYTVTILPAAGASPPPPPPPTTTTQPPTQTQQPSTN
jgi:hypothetical protein